MAGEKLTVEVLVSEAGLGTALRLALPDAWILVDTGDGSASRLAERAADPNRLEGIVFTHGHPDHVSGLYAVLARLRNERRADPLPLRAPRGCTEPQVLLSAWRRRYPSTSGFATRLAAVDPGADFRLGPFRLRPFRVRHRGSLPSGRRGLLAAVGYEILAAGLRIVISGDTGPCSRLERVARGADLVLVEATYARAPTTRPDSHMSVAQARRVGRLARRYRLYHLGPDSRPLLRPGEEATIVTL